VCSVTGVAGPSVYLTAADLCERYHCSRMSVYRQIKQHHFPKSLKFGDGVDFRWRRADVDACEEIFVTRPAS
jgi:predicted DNA-binding transcriptional regulator AlpA